MNNELEEQAVWLNRINTATDKEHLFKEAREVVAEVEKSDCHDQEFLLKLKSALMNHPSNLNSEGKDIFHELLSTRGKNDNIAVFS